eukprot:GILJ01001516.1.p1 GENE.GILJ01001516.1~~GILJ01001516.1.p1  ORF type:complete len:379 (+),score=48.96 GILJ01001516.1:49-1185(+)
MKRQITALAIACVLVAVNADLGCLDASGKPVDWWFLYKLPRDSGSKSTYPVASGVAFAYFYESSSALSYSKVGLDDASSPLTKTMKQLNTKNAWLFYNDENADSDSSSYAHSKGVLALDKSQGFWLMHSMPSFPLPMSQTDGVIVIPDEGKKYGQVFFCTTYDVENIASIASGILINHPNVYDSNIPSTLSKLVPSWLELVGKKTVKTNTHVQDVKTVGQMKLTHFAKSARSSLNLYEEVIQPKLKVNLQAVTWGRPLMPSWCKPTYQFDSINVLKLAFSDVTSFTTGSDHSKWAVSTTGGTWVCVADTNRMTSQTKRGGGALCTQHKALHKALTALITDVEECTKSESDNVEVESSAPSALDGFRVLPALLNTVAVL